MKLTPLRERAPEPYMYFIAYNKDTNEYFKNYLVKSEFNYFYIAGKRFTHWMKI